MTSRQVIDDDEAADDAETAGKREAGVKGFDWVGNLVYPEDWWPIAKPGCR